MTPMIQQRIGGVDNITLTPQQEVYFQQEYDKRVRNPNSALILTVVFGGLGAHRFYLREWGWGMAYVLFFWTYIPSIISIMATCWPEFGSSLVFNPAQCRRGKWRTRSL
jgi:TM2 domain-containing membrane protein YozV